MEIILGIGEVGLIVYLVYWNLFILPSKVKSLEEKISEQNAEISYWKNQITTLQNNILMTEKEIIRLARALKENDQNAYVQIADDLNNRLTEHETTGFVWKN